MQEALSILHPDCGTGLARHLMPGIPKTIHMLLTKKGNQLCNV